MLWIIAAFTVGSLVGGLVTAIIGAGKIHELQRANVLLRSQLEWQRQTGL